MSKTQTLANGWDSSIPVEIQVDSDWISLLDAMTPELTLRPKLLPHKEIDLIDNVFSASECGRIIAAAENYGFGRTEYRKSYRGNLRLMCKDAPLASALYQRMLQHLPLEVTEENEVWSLSGLNEVFRLSKYNASDRFQRHVDTFYQRPLNDGNTLEKSMFTVNIYLNEDFEGGATRFYNGPGDQEASITPTSGLCLLFRQPPTARLLHDGEEVKRGVKYLIRSDVMYRRVSHVVAAAAENDETDSTVESKSILDSVVDYVMGFFKNKL